MSTIIALIVAAVTFGTVLMYGTLGEILTEKSGNLNLGVEGIMYMGGAFGLAGAFYYEKAAGAAASGPAAIIIAILAAFAAGMAASAIYSFLTITLRANQNVTGLTLTIFGTGVANFLGGSLNKLAGGVGQISVPYTSDAFKFQIFGSLSSSSFGKLFLSYGWMVYLAIIIAVVMQIFLSKTRKGLNLRAVGENPTTADAAGINVTKYKYGATCIGCGIVGLGGLFYVMDYIGGTWANDGSIESLGWLAVALVIFTTWKSANSIWGAYLFGLLYWMFYYIEGLTRSSQEIFKMLPYVVTILVLIIISFRKKKENLGPQSLGLSYFREER